VDPDAWKKSNGGREIIIGVLYVNISWDTYGFKSRIDFRSRFVPVCRRRRSCLSSKHRPYPQCAGDAVPSDEYALIVGEMLVRTRSYTRCPGIHRDQKCA